MSVTRRQFGLALGSTVLAHPAAGAATQAAGLMPWNEPAVVRKVYLATTRITWPRPDLDIEQERAQIEARLAEVAQRNARWVRLTGGEILRTGDNVAAWAAQTGDADALLVIDLTSGLYPLMAELRKVDTPMLLFARPYSGWAYNDFASWRAAGKKVELTSSSDFNDLDYYMPLFRSIRHVRKSRILLVDEGGQAERARAFTRHFGTAVQTLPYSELKAAFDAADPAAARREAAAFTRGALKVVEPSRAEIDDSVRLYLAIRSLLKRENANAMTIDCLGGFRRGDLPAYPCVAWSRLNDEGLYGVCEADLLSTMTQLLVTSFCGKPGYVSDPVFDVSRNEVIHAHCVSATCLDGIGAPPSPYIIRSHMEDNKGVSLQVLAPASGRVTVAKFASPDRMLVSTGEVCGNVDDRRGCRTKIRTRVTDARKLLENYSSELHRVVFYGDYVDRIARLGRLLGYQTVSEI